MEGENIKEGEGEKEAGREEGVNVKSLRLTVSELSVARFTRRYCSRATRWGYDNDNNNKSREIQRYE